RAMDETALPPFEREENWENPELGRKHALDREAFGPVADAYYRHLGWDVETGRPTQETLETLGLGEVYGPMTAGAAAAEGSRAGSPGAGDPARDDA
ncbi:MAG: hypothetical protein GX649_18780, partial [Chloroflexi bacterium]|nr:hypothetical protein [Chloroflexota bacterium]